jgi:hypothetical protein
VLLKITWAALVVIAMALMTNGLWATVHIEPTSEAIAAERRGNVLILVAAVLLVALAAVADRALAAPHWASLAIVAAAVVCVGVAMTPAVAVISLVVAYPLTLAALIGCLFMSRGDRVAGPHGR